MDCREYFPSYINKRYEELDAKPELKHKSDEITDFLFLIKKIWCISNKAYQVKVWVNLELVNKIVDSFDDTVMFFREDAEIVLEASGSERVKMSPKQRTMLKTLYDMVDGYASKLEEYTDPKLVINDPKWDHIRQYAKLVYQEITGEESTETITSWDILD